MKILVIEDEISLSDSVRQFLTSAGHVCETAITFKEALEKTETYNYDVVVLDLGLPDGSGLDIIDELKSTGNKAGILIISAKNSVQKKIEGLEKGADDYLAKPFHLAELHARIKSLNRRINFNGNNELRIAEILIFPDNRRVFVHENEIELTKTEFDLLMFFCSNLDRVITKATISEHLWGDYMDYADSHDFIYSHIKNLRKKLSAAGCNDYLKTIYSVGYKFSVS